MKRRMIVTASATAFAVGLLAAPAAADPPSCNWGQLTQYAILELDFDQGGHSSSSDATEGPGRAGLANVVARGDMEATCELIESLLP